MPHAAAAVSRRDDLAFAKAAVIALPLGVLAWLGLAWVAVEAWRRFA